MKRRTQPGPIPVKRTSKGVTLRPADIEDLVREIERPIAQLQKVKLVLRSLPSPIDWQKHERRFESVHPSFRSHLLERAPNLSMEEIRLARMLRLEIAIPDIASMLAISVRVTRALRSSLRAKLGIPKGTSDIQYLKQI